MAGNHPQFNFFVPIQCAYFIPAIQCYTTPYPPPPAPSSLEWSEDTFQSDEVELRINDLKMVQGWWRTVVKSSFIHVKDNKVVKYLFSGNNKAETSEESLYQDQETKEVFYRGHDGFKKRKSVVWKYNSQKITWLQSTKPEFHKNILLWLG